MQGTKELFVPSFINDFPNRKILLPFVTISCLYYFFALIHGLINKTHGRFITIHHSQHLHKRLTEQNNLFCIFAKYFFKHFVGYLFPFSLFTPSRFIPLIARKYFPQVSFFINNGLQRKKVCCKSRNG